MRRQLLGGAVVRNIVGCSCGLSLPWLFALIRYLAVSLSVSGAGALDVEVLRSAVSLLEMRSVPNCKHVDYRKSLLGAHRGECVRSHRPAKLRHKVLPCAPRLSDSFLAQSEYC